MSNKRGCHKLKKRRLLVIVALAMVMALFSGCGHRNTIDDGSAEDAGEKGQETTETAEVVAKELSESDLIITRQDYSRKDEQGELLAEVYYDLVQLPETSDAYIRINTFLQSDYQKFLDSIEDPDFQQYLEGAEDSRAAYSGDDWWNYFDTFTVSVTTCEDNILSVCYVQEWYMGGVANRNAYGLSFDLKTGDPITLDSIAQTVQENADFLGYIKSHIYWTMIEESKIDASTMDYFPDLQLDDLTFYLEDKELVVYINTYQLASGAVGSFAVPTGLFVDQPQGTIDVIDGQTWYGLYPAEDGSIRMPIINLEESGTYSTWGAYYRSDAGVMIDGTYEIEHAARDIIYFHGTTPSDGTYSTEGAYEIIRIGDSIQLLQLGDDILYKNDPLFGVWTLRTEVPM